MTQWQDVQPYPGPEVGDRYVLRIIENLKEFQIGEPMYIDGQMIGFAIDAHTQWDHIAGKPLTTVTIDTELEEHDS